jgi:hypothetical protein
MITIVAIVIVMAAIAVLIFNGVREIRLRRAIGRSVETRLPDLLSGSREWTEGSDSSKMQICILIVRPLPSCHAPGGHNGQTITRSIELPLCEF